MSHDPNYFSSITDSLLAEAPTLFGIQSFDTPVLGVDAPVTASQFAAESWLKFQNLNPSLDNYKFILINAGGHKVETSFIIARATEFLKQNGGFIIAAANDVGGKSIAGLLDQFGLQYQKLHKRKHQIYYVADLRGLQTESIQQALSNGGVRQRSDGLYTMAGVFSADKIDTGTEILRDYLSEISLNGQGADFGCGIGVLADFILKQHKDVRAIDSIELDARAVFCATKNLAGFNNRSTVIQADATNFKPQKQYDFIVTNPPFHKGKLQSVSLGQSIVKQALLCLKTSGVLYIVANVALPYENLLVDLARTVSIERQSQGFKILKVVK